MGSVDLRESERAVLQGNAAVLQRVLDAVAPADRAAFLAEQIIVAARAQHRHIVALLLKAGADLNCARDRICPLANAIRFRAPLAWVDFLLASGANPSGPPGTRAWGSPLCAAGSIAQADIVERLIAAGADVNAGNDSGGPLESACTSCGQDVRVIRLLLQAGAQVSPRVAFALLRNRESPVAAMELLLAHGLQLTEYNRALAEAAMHSLAMLNLLRRTGLSFQPDTDGKDNVLHTIAYAGLNSYKHGAPPREAEVGDVIRTLVSMGLDVSQRSKSSKPRGTAPLHCAAQRLPHTIAPLIECGADVNVRDDDGNTPLHHAVQFSSWGLEEIVAELVLAGADLAARNNEGHTPQDLYARPGWASLLPRTQKIL